MKSYQSVSVTKIIVTASPGSTMGESMREAISIAASEWVNIELHHNGKRYMVRPNDLITSIETIKDVVVNVSMGV